MTNYTYEEIINIETETEIAEEKLKEINNSLRILEMIMERFNEIAKSFPEE